MSNLSILGPILAVVMIFITQPVSSSEYVSLIPEDYLRAQFDFDDGEQLKYSACKKKTYSTCTYIWGRKSKRDTTRTQYGLEPEGNKLQIIYAQARTPKDFQGILANNSDAEKINGVGVEAAWSNQRKQLSFMTDSNLIIHINIDDKGTSEPKDKAITIASYLLEQLSL